MDMKLFLKLGTKYENVSCQTVNDVNMTLDEWKLLYKIVGNVICDIEQTIYEQESEI